jgi:hypothetical protein
VWCQGACVAQRAGVLRRSGSCSVQKTASCPRAAPPPPRGLEGLS